MSRKAAASLALLCIVTACGSTEPTPTPPVQPDAGAQAEPTPAPEPRPLPDWDNDPPASWWKKGDAACPDRATLVRDGGDEDNALYFCTVDGREHGPWVSLDGGSKYEEGWMRDGNRHGRWRSWAYGTKPSVIAHYKDGEYHGRVQQFDANGAPTSDEQYKDGALDGVSKQYGEGGVLAKEISYSGGALHGPVTEYYSSGEKRRTLTYAGGKLDGAQVRLARDGKELGRFTMTAGSGTYTEWYDDGAKKLEEQRKDGAANGPRTEWRENGKKSASGAMAAGKKDGVWTSWDDAEVATETQEYSAGILARATALKRGKPIRITTYYDHGSAREVADQRGGRAHGPATTYHANTRRASQGQNRRGKKHGTWVEFDESGAVTATVTYRNGREVRRKEGGTAPAGHPGHQPGGPMTGIPECDAYFSAILACDKLPEQSKQAVLQAIEAWRQTATSGDANAQEAVRNACVQAQEAWKQAGQSIGC